MGLLLLFQPATADITAPVLSSPTYSGLGATTVTPVVTTNEGNGTAYHVILPTGATAPNGNQVKAGTDGLGTPGVASGSKTITTTGSQTFTQATGLTNNTTYDVYYVHEDAAFNQSNVVNTSFATLIGDTIMDDYPYQERLIRGSTAFISSNYVTSVTLVAGTASVYAVASGTRALKIANVGTGDVYLAYGQTSAEAETNLGIAAGAATQGHEYFEDTTAATFESEAIRVIGLPRGTKFFAICNATATETPTVRITQGK